MESPHEGTSLRVNNLGTGIPQPRKVAVNVSLTSQFIDLFNGVTLLTVGALAVEQTPLNSNMSMD